LSKTELSSLVNGYKLCAQTEGKSKKTIDAVTSSVTYFERFLRYKGLVADVTEIGPREIRAFILYLQQKKCFSTHPFAKPQSRGLSGHTINCYLRSIRAFWSWLEVEGLIEQNPFSGLRIPKAPKKAIPTFSADQIRALLTQVDTLSAAGFRNYTIILLLLDTMIRVSELTRCQMDDLNLQGRVLKVWGKGSKERIVPSGRTAQKTLWRSITFYRPEPRFPRQDMLFLTADGGPMTKNRVEAVLKAYGKKAGIKGVRVSPHTFRHTGAVAFLRNGGDLFTLQRIMGHSSLEVLRGYVALSQADLARVHGRASPLDNLGLVTPRMRKGGNKKTPSRHGSPSAEEQ